MKTEIPTPETTQEALNPPFFQAMCKLTKDQTDTLLGLICMESLARMRDQEDILKELLNTFRISSLEDMRQSHYKDAVYLTLRHIFLSWVAPADAPPQLFRPTVPPWMI